MKRGKLKMKMRRFYSESTDGKSIQHTVNSDSMFRSKDDRSVPSWHDIKDGCSSHGFFRSPFEESEEMTDYDVYGPDDNDFGTKQKVWTVILTPGYNDYSVWVFDDEKSAMDFIIKHIQAFNGGKYRDLYRELKQTGTLEGNGEDWFIQPGNYFEK